VEVYGEGTEEEEYTETMAIFPINATILKEVK
jgi:hypothetical protein